MRNKEDVLVRQDWSLRQDAYLIYRHNIALEETKISSAPVIKSLNELINKAESEIEEVKNNLKIINYENLIEDRTRLDSLNQELFIAYDKAIKIAEISLNMAAKVKQLKDCLDRK